MELAAKYEEKYEERAAACDLVSEQEKTLISLRMRLKEFETLSENLEILERTKHQLEDLQIEHAKLKKTSEDHVVLQDQLSLVQKQKEELSKELGSLKTYLFEIEQQLLESDNRNKATPDPLSPRRYRVLEEIKHSSYEILSLCKALDTTSREIMAVYTEKREKLVSDLKFMESYEKTRSKDEKIRMIQAISSGPSFGFLNFIPKKLRNLQMLEECVTSVIKAKEGKLGLYEVNISKYEDLSKAVSTKYGEYELKLGCY